jgi:predicted DNA-binding transcriptional regulator AlpA
MQKPAFHLLDRRADQLTQEVESGRDLLTTKYLAEFLSVSVQWLEIGRSRGWGPPFVKFGPRRIRYRKSDVINWLNERKSYHTTSEYGEGAT